MMWMKRNSIKRIAAMALAIAMVSGAAPFEIGGIRLMPDLSASVSAAENVYVKQLTMADLNGKTSWSGLGDFVALSSESERNALTDIPSGEIYLVWKEGWATKYTDGVPGSLYSLTVANAAMYMSGGAKVYYTAAHQHDWQYTAVGDTITAHCTSTSGTCGYTSDPELVIAGPRLTKYGENATANAELTGLDGFNEATGLSVTADVITYVGRDNTNYEQTTEAPTGAGKYTASITVEGKTASVDYEIAKADPTVQTVRGLKATYGDTLADVELPAGWAWTDSTQSVGHAGSSTFTADYTPEDTDNFNILEDVALTVTVDKADAAATAPTAAEGLEYTGEAQALVVPGSTEDGAILYSSDGETFEATVPTGTDAGSYTVYWAVKGDSDHNDTTPESISVSIAPADPTVGAPTAITGLTYTGEAQELITPGSTSGGTMMYLAVSDDLGGKLLPTDIVSLMNGNEGKQVKDNDMTQQAEALEWSAAIPTGTDAGKYTVWYKSVGDDNYNSTEPQSLNVSIAKVGQTAPKVTSTDETVMDAKDGTISGLEEGMEVLYPGAENYTAAAEPTLTGLAAGRYFVRRASDKNYIESDAVEVVIGQGTPVAPKPSIAIAFGGRTGVFSSGTAGVDIYYQFGSSNITSACKHVKAGETIFLDEPMTGNKAAMYFKSYRDGKWSKVGKWGVLNVKIDEPLIVQSGRKNDNNFKIYTQTKDSYIVYTLDGTGPAIEEGIQSLKIKNGTMVWSTSKVINVPKGKTVRAIAIRSGLVTSDVMTYTNN